MATNTYGIPGAAVYLKDYSIQAEAVTTPGDVVVLLADMPDTINTVDANDPMKLKTIPLTPNVPILVTGASDLSSVITGENVIGGTATNKSLDIVNVLGMVSDQGTKPLAVCKIIKRDGTRPDMTNLFEVYEALEYAYESLGNYPAGAIVPIGISFEDSFDKTYYNRNFKVVKATSDEVNVVGNVYPMTNDMQDVFVVKDDSFAAVANKTYAVTTQAVVGVDTSITIMVDGVSAVLTIDGATVAGKIPAEEKLLNVRTVDKPELPEVADVANGGTLDAFKTYAYKVSFYDTTDETKETQVSGMTEYMTTDEDKKSIEISVPVCIDPTATNIGRKIYREVDGNGLFTLLTKIADNTTATFIDGVDVYVGKSDVTMEPTTGTLTVTDTAYATTKEAVMRLSNGTEVVVPTGSILGFGTTAILKGNFIIDVQSSNYFNVKRKYTNKLHCNEIVVKDETGEYAPTKGQTFTVELKRTTGVGAKEGYVVVDGEQKDMLEPGSLAKEYIELDQVTFTSLVDYDVVLEDGVIITVKAGAKFDNEVTISATNSTYEDIFTTKKANTYVVNTVPVLAEPVMRSLEFCLELTKDLNECRAYFGTIPAENSTTKKIKDQVARLSTLPKARVGFEKLVSATEKIDLGAYLVVTVGAQKVNGSGGIEGFQEEEIVSNTSIPTYVVETTKNIKFAVDDLVEIYATKGVDIVVQSGLKVVEVEQGLTTTKITLNAQIDYTKFKNLPQVFIQNINKKDNKGSYLAALYAVVANNYGIDKAPMNVTFPGTAEVLYTRQQATALNLYKYTVVNRESTGTTGYVVDTPTMARDESDFTDQSSIGLLLYFTNKLRAIAKTKQGKRFGSADAQLMFKKELEAPLEAEKGNAIVDFYLNTDFSLLNTKGICLVEFGIKEAKTLKFIKFVARLY